MPEHAQQDHEHGTYDLRSGLQRIARNVLRRPAGASERRPQSLREESGGPGRTCAPPGRSGPCTPLHGRAAAELGALSSRIICDPRTIAAMALLVDDRDTIEPAGALTFACLLYLTDRGDAAEFWWQFAAGAGSATAAHCLYLHHLQHSEREAAGHWHDQARELYRPSADWALDGPPGRVEGDASPVDTGWFGTDVLYQWAAEHAAELACERARGITVRWWVFATRLTDAIGQLEVTDDDFGTIPRPAPALAAELRECVVSGL
ncbi:hypothetical protein ACFP1Z_19790 [Streptomyces gamaensis]|uniref:Uncharacterized protein n=1 Tax=Streptomyces gamaensis TaxID=1763542 RepID=A0ABW0Z3C7_9ACTN